MLSVIIPCFNSNVNLIKIISLLANVNDIKIIIVDDHGNEDASLIEMNLPNLIIHRLPENMGAGAARNFGITLTDTPYVTFVDADDLILVDKINDAITTIKSNNDIDIFYFFPLSHKLNGSEGTRSDRYQRLINQYLSFSDESIRYKFHVPWSKIFKRQLLLDNRIFFDEISASNDVIFSLKCGMAAKKIAVSNQAFYSVLEHDSGLTGFDTLNRLKDRMDVVVRYNTILYGKGKGNYSISLLPLLWRLCKVDFIVLIKYVICGKYSLLRDIIPSTKSMINFYKFK